jgi:hypothetical protein
MPKRTRAEPRRRRASPAGNILYSLDVVCVWVGIGLPKAKALSPYDIPLPLYGRQTEVIHHGAKIGDIVEVLPPV